MENNIFEVTERKASVEFKVEGLPNDMKMLAFCNGELTNSAYFFTTFGNVNQGDSNDVNKGFSLDGKSDWSPFLNKKRVSDRAKIDKKKIELSRKSTTYSIYIIH